MPRAEPNGRFQVLHRIASGGMAEVFLSRMVGPQGFERLVALKKVRARFTKDARFVERLVTEARIMVRLSHGNICQVLDFGIMDGQYFLAMEHVSGCDLGVLLHGLARQSLAFPPVLAAYVVAEVCRGLDYAHRRTDEAGCPLGIVHRDVTPENVLISYDGEVKLTDFGISRVRGVETPDEAAGVVLGKAAYLAPEQLSGGRGDARTDIFSVGILLWEMLVGLPLFRRATDRQTIEAVLRYPIESPSKLRPEVPEPLDAISSRALARRPRERYGSAAALLEDLSRFIAARAPGMTGASLAELVSNQVPRRGTTDEALATAEVTVPRDVVSLALEETNDAPPVPRNRRTEPPLSEMPSMPNRPRTMPFEAFRSGRSSPVRMVLIASAAFITVAVGVALGLSNPSRPQITVRPLDAAVQPRAPDAVRTAPRRDARQGLEAETSSMAPAPPALRPASSAPDAGASKSTQKGGPPASRDGHRERERERVSSRAPGYINVNARPWGRVYVDGRVAANETPARLMVSPGPHVVKVYFVTVARYSASRRIVIESGQSIGLPFVLEDSP